MDQPFKTHRDIYFIAEIGSNHNKDLERVKLLVNKVKHSDCDAVKFQYFKADKLWHENFPNQRMEAKKGEVTLKFLERSSEIVHSYGISFGCSVFHMEDIEKIAAISDFIKISSFDCLREDFVNKCLTMEKPVFISTGTCNIGDIQKVINYPLRDYDGIFHCMSIYPIPTHKIQLYAMQHTFIKLQKQIYLGWSDHSVSPGVIYGAVGAKFNVMEVHVDLPDMKGGESHYGHCWNIRKLKKVIKTARIMVQTMKPMNWKNRSDTEASRYRADPTDGMRPLKKFR